MRVMLFNASPKAYGATQEILNIIRRALPGGAQADEVCLGNVPLEFCLGCKQCYETGDCVRGGQVRAILDRMNACDAVVIACPSYWADIPAQFKAFIDRCTPYADTAPANGHWHLRSGICCYGIALRTGGRTEECEHILSCIEHFCGHMGLRYGGGLCLTRIEGKKDIAPHAAMLQDAAARWLSAEEGQA